MQPEGDLIHQRVYTKSEYDVRRCSSHVPPGGCSSGSAVQLVSVERVWKGQRWAPVAAFREKMAHIDVSSAFLRKKERHSFSGGGMSWDMLGPGSTRVTGFGVLLTIRPNMTVPAIPVLFYFSRRSSEGLFETKPTAGP